MFISRDSTLKEIINTPVGHDVIERILYAAGLSLNIINSPLGNLKLKSIKTLSFGKFDDQFIEALLKIFNSLNDEVKEDKCEIKPKWWKEAVFYQIYPRSFKDSNDDGIGDIRGIIEKLDYIESLGVNALWLSPFYDSPNADNGYDVRDYKKIMSEFGTMEDVEELLVKAHEKNIKVIVDLVLNHTSDEHEWFKKSLENDDKYRDFYLWKDKPNNWNSTFGTEGWTYYPERKKWALHLFAKKQIDLNWDNPEVRAAMYDVANFWLDKGADGFRLDVISFISKTNGLPDGNTALGKLLNITGIEHYFHGPHLDKYLHEFYEKCLKGRDAYTVGECPGNGIKMARLITGDDRGELSQLFSFDHLDNPGKTRYHIYDFSLVKMIPEIVKWQTSYSNHCWPTLFFDNHDFPRMSAKINKNGHYHERIQKLLATLLFTLKGTPYVYQGSELAMNNHDFKSLAEYRDIESFQYHQKFLDWGHGPKTALKRLQVGSRDNARTPMCWDNSEYAGFSKVEPWIGVNSDYKERNVEVENNKPYSCLNYYRNLIKYRKEHSTLIYGQFEQIKTVKNIFAYYRYDENHRYLVVMNLVNYPVRCKLKEGELIFSNYKNHSDKLMAYEANVYCCK